MWLLGVAIAIRQLVGWRGGRMVVMVVVMVVGLL